MTDNTNSAKIAASQLLAQAAIDLLDSVEPQEPIWSEYDLLDLQDHELPQDQASVLREAACALEKLGNNEVADISWDQLKNLIQSQLEATRQRLECSVEPTALANG